MDDATRKFNIAKALMNNRVQGQMGYVPDSMQMPQYMPNGDKVNALPTGMMADHGTSVMPPQYREMLASLSTKPPESAVQPGNPIPTDGMGGRPDVGNNTAGSPSDGGMAARSAMGMPPQNRGLGGLMARLAARTRGGM